MASLVAGRSSGLHFQTRYLAMRNADIDATSDLPCSAISDAFWDVEDFEDDAALRDGPEGWYDEDELRRRVELRLAETLAEFRGELG